MDKDRDIDREAEGLRSWQAGRQIKEAGRQIKGGGYAGSQSLGQPVTHSPGMSAVSSPSHIRPMEAETIMPAASADQREKRECVCERERE
jgi:hypothetical protein